MSKRAQPPRPARRAPLSMSRASLGIFALALVVRLFGLRWGLPDGTHFFSFHPDEFETAGRAIRILNTGDWDPEFFNYGSLFLYLTTILAWPFHALHIVQTVTGTHVVARVLSAILGAATVLVTERIGRRYLDPRYARLAALFVAIAPGYVLHSGFATVDVTATFLVTLTLWLTLRATERRGVRPWILAGTAAGFAIGTKYASGIVLIATFVAALAARGVPWRRRLIHAGAAKAAAIVAALASVPYALVTPDLFRDDVRYELLVHPLEGHRNYFVNTGDGWSYHLASNLPYVLGPPLLVAGLAGIVLAFVRRRTETTILLAFAVPYFAGVGLSNVRFLRYALPLVPILALGAAAAISVFETTPARRILARRVSMAVVAWTALLTLVQGFAMVRPDPRTRAAQWVTANFAPGTTVGFPTVPWFSTSPLTPWNGGERSRQRFLQELAAWRFVLCEDWNVATLENAKPALFVMSEFDDRDARRLKEPDAVEFFTVLERDYAVAARFTNVGPTWRLLFGRPFPPHDWLYPFADVTVWRRK